MSTSPTPHVGLEDLIHGINASQEEPLKRLTSAVLLAEQLNDVADSLIGHFVDQARRAGASWSEIGRSMGVTKQAVQKRFAGRGPDAEPPLDPSQGFSRFNEQARAVVVAAQELARTAGNDTIGVAHLVLALVAHADGAAARAVSAQGVSLDEVRRIASAALPPAAATVPALVPFDAHARDALERTFREAEQRGSDMIGSEHILLAVLAVEDGTGVLAGLGVTHAGVARHLGGEEKMESR